MPQMHQAERFEGTALINAGDSEFSADLLRGGAELATFLFQAPEQRRRFYHLATTSRLPVFKLGGLWCGRKSVLLKWIQNQETQR